MDIKRRLLQHAEVGSRVSWLEDWNKERAIPEVLQTRGGCSGDLG